MECEGKRNSAFRGDLGKQLFAESLNFVLRVPLISVAHSLRPRSFL
jgi:hypothetical protein